MTWKFNNEKLTRELMEAGHTDLKTVDGDDIYVAQIGTGTRILSVEEFLEICELLDEEPASYIEYEYPYADMKEK